METGGWLSGGSAEMESCFHLVEENIQIPLRLVLSHWRESLWAEVDSAPWLTRYCPNRPNGWKTFSPDPKNPVSMALPQSQHSSYLSETDLIGPPFSEKTSVGSHRIVNFWAGLRGHPHVSVPSTLHGSLKPERALPSLKLPLALLPPGLLWGAVQIQNSKSHLLYSLLLCLHFSLIHLLPPFFCVIFGILCASGRQGSCPQTSKPTALAPSMPFT